MNISATRTKSALIIGAASSLAEPLCRGLAARGYGLILAARDERELEIRAGDVSTRYPVAVRTLSLDLTAKDFSALRLIQQAGAFDTLFLVAGDMGTSEQDDLTNLSHVAMVNYVLPSQILSVAAEAMSESGGGKMVVIGSVAGDRGRAANYEYGAAKAALEAFASGLRQRYSKSGISVLLAKPGFLDTPMTWGMESPLIASREKAAEAILSAMEKGRDVIYAPWFWRFIMLIICHIPERIFKKLKL